MKKFNLIAAMMLLVFSAQATIDSMVRATKTGGYGFMATFYSMTGAPQHWYYLTSSIPMSSTPFTSGTYAGTFTGIHNDLLTGTDSTNLYVRVVSWLDSMPTVRDTSSEVVVRRPADIFTVVPTRSATAISLAITSDPGQGRAVMGVTMYTTSALGACTGCPMLPLATFTDSAYGMVSHTYTMPSGTLTPHTHYWFEVIYTNDVAPDTMVIDAWTYSSPTLAAVNFLSEVHTAYTADVSVETNFYDYIFPHGTYYQKVAGMPWYTDSIPDYSYSVMTGYQARTYSTAVWPSTTYEWAYKASGHFFPTIITGSFTTDAPPPVFDLNTVVAYYDSVLGLIRAHSIYSNLSWLHYCNFVVELTRTPGGPAVTFHPYMHLYGSGAVNDDFWPSDTGNYYVHIVGADTVGNYRDGGYVLVHVSRPTVILPPPTIDSFGVDSSITSFGGIVNVGWITSNGDVTLNDVPQPAIGSITTVPLLRDTTFVLKVTQGTLVVTDTIYVVVIGGLNVFVKNVSPMSKDFSMYPSPMHDDATIKCANWKGRTYSVQDMSGKVIAQIKATGPETTFTGNTLPPGSYVISNGRKAVKFIKQ